VSSFVIINERKQEIPVTHRVKLKWIEALETYIFVAEGTPEVSFRIKDKDARPLKFVCRDPNWLKSMKAHIKQGVYVECVNLPNGAEKSVYTQWQAHDVHELEELYNDLLELMA